MSAFAEPGSHGGGPVIIAAPGGGPNLGVPAQPIYLPFQQVVKRTKGTNQIDLVAESPLVLRTMEMQPVEVEVTREVPYEDCTGASPGNGTDGNWGNLFNIPKKDKPQALADSVEGIDLKTARIIIEKGYFSSKPRSWNDFKDYIRQIEREAKLPGLSNKVINDRRAATANHRNLGYVRTGCKIVYRQEKYIEVQVQKVPVDHPVPGQSKKRNITVKVDNGPLLLGEQEEFVVTYQVQQAPPPAPPGKMIEVVSVEGRTAYQSGYRETKSESTADSTTVTMQGQGRVRVPVPSGAVQIIPRAVNGKLQLQATPALDPDAGGSISVTVTTLEKGSFGKKHATGTKTFQVEGGKASMLELNQPADLTKNAIVDYTIQVSGSPYYSENPTATQRKNEKPQ